MKFAKGTDSVAGESYKLYTGIAPVSIVGINPTAEQLSKIYGRTIDKIADYKGKDKNGNNYSRVDFIVKTSPKFTETPVHSKVTFFIREDVRKNADETKIQVINEFGQTAWVTQEIFSIGGVPQKNDGTDMNYHIPYRQCFVGEEDFTNFLIAYMGIPSLVKYVDGNPVPKTGDELKDCYASLDLSEIKKIIDGNISPLKEILASRPNNEVYVMFVVQTNDKNNKYQSILPYCFAKGKDNKFKDRFQYYVNNNTQRMEKFEYSFDFKEYKETPNEIPSNEDNETNWPWP